MKQIAFFAVVAFFVTSMGCSGAGVDGRGDAGDCTPMFRGDPNSCGACDQTLEAYCDGPCAPLSEWDCGEFESAVVQEELEHGCGYLRASYTGDVGDQWGRVFDESTGDLVYAWDNGRRSSGCVDAVRAGNPPSCDSWEEVACDDLVGDARAK